MIIYTPIISGSTLITGSVVLTGSLRLPKGQLIYATSSFALNGKSSSYARLVTNLKGGNITASGAIINGNLTVLGTTTLISASYVYISSSHVIIGDNIVTLNAFSPYKRFAGIEINDSGSNEMASFLWDSVGNYFFISGSTETNSQNKVIIGPNNNTNLTTNTVPKATSGNQLGNSNITDNGSLVSINSETKIVASSLTVDNFITSSKAKFTGLQPSATGYYLTIDNTTGNIFKSTATPAGSSGTAGSVEEW